MTARHVVVRGRVQGVFFRASTREVARQHGVTGWVSNRADGAVEARLEGPEPGVEAVLDWIRDGGPDHARVEGVEVASVPPDGYGSFVVR
ncbi:MAG: acylphosphatase [Nitriliruptoraceae bacterium]